MTKTKFFPGWLVQAAMLLMLSTGCEKNDQELAALKGEEYLVFGTYFGHCRGEQCIEIFKLQGGKLYEDVRDIYPTQFYQTGYQGDFKELDNNKFTLAKDLPAALPAELYNERDTTIGMPDFGDWGGIYIETFDTQGEKRYWFIDNMESNLPEYLKPFAAKVKMTVEGINQE